MTVEEKILKAMDDGTYWVNWKSQYIPLSLIGKIYARRIRWCMRMKLKPEQ